MVVNSFSLPSKGWKNLSTCGLDIKYNGKLIHAIENRPKDGEVWLLSSEHDGYHVVGYFTDLDSLQQEKIKKLLIRKMGQGN